MLLRWPAICESRCTSTFCLDNATVISCCKLSHLSCGTSKELIQANDETEVGQEAGKLQMRLGLIDCQAS